MAFLNVDPAPMMLPGFSRVVVQGREPFIRMVTPRATPSNEDLAIVTVSPSRRKRYLSEKSVMSSLGFL
jgi:hypothetical protein